MSNVIAVAPQPGSLAEVDSSCGQVEAWAANCDSIPQIQDAKNRLGAIDEYLARTTKEGRARVAAAMRRLEVRIGELLGPPEPGKRTDLQEPVGRDQQVPEMDRKTKHDFRQMAANPDVVEQTIEASDDDNPASRRKVMTNIKNDTTADELALIARYDDATPDQKSALATELGLSGRRSLQGKIEKLRRKHGAAPPANSPALTGLKITNIRVLAEGGHSSHQIAKKIKISAGRVRGVGHRTPDSHPLAGRAV